MPRGVFPKGNKGLFKKGCKTWNKGKKWPEEHKQKLSKIHTGKKLSEVHKRNIGLAGKGRKNSEEMKKKISQILKGHIVAKETREKLRTARLKQKSIIKNTSIELKIEKELKERNIYYQKQVPLCGVAIVDFYLPETRTIIQCDGCYWHGCPKHYPNRLSLKDEKQNRIFIFNGFNVYRFWECEINNYLKKCVDKLNIC